MITRAAIVGMGTMGPGMAATLARAGIDVRCYDVSDAAMARVPLEVAIASGVLDRIHGEPAASPGTVSVHGDLAGTVQDAELVIESVPENADVKAAVFDDIESHAPAAAILATNTSGIPVTTIQEPLQNPARVIGMHWSNPPHVIPVIEVIAGERTSAETVESLRSLIADLRLTSVRVLKDVPGFVENRVLYAIMRECLSLVDNGVVSAEELDACVQWGIGFKLSVIPPLQLLDVAGLDIYHAVASYLNRDLDSRADVSETITERVKAGNLGMKTGSGMFDYTAEQAQELRMARASKLIAVRQAIGGGASAKEA
ncbi:MAG: 3-hydroxyacyl-CoA dehydrogenase NAD-binding domain-containing protein [Streptosporangiaceae bacterium]